MFENFKALPILLLTTLMIMGVAINNKAESANWKNLQIVNRTGRTIEKIYIGNNDCLGESVLRNSKSFSIRYDADIKYWDITMVLRGGKSYGYHCDLSGAWRITFFQNYKTASFGVAKN
jgi:hypothetical protein